jgi:uncharacterized protein
MRFHSAKKRNNMNKKSLILTFYSIFLAFSIPLNASFYPDKPTAWVNDYADILSPAEEQNLNQKLSHYQDSTGTQIFIVTTNDHQGAPISAMAAEIGQKWGVGERSEDNGLLILTYPNDREIFIATGYGVEQYITDAISKRIIENEIAPSFRVNDYHGGFDKATDVIMNLLSGVFTAEQYNKGKGEGSSALFIIFLLIFMTIIFSNAKKSKSNTIGKNLPLWMALSMLGGSGSRHSGSFGNFRSGGGSFGGFSGGMGGRFGGGGAGGSW